MFHFFLPFGSKQKQHGTAGTDERTNRWGGREGGEGMGASIWCCMSSSWSCLWLVLLLGGREGVQGATTDCHQQRRKQEGRQYEQEQVENPLVEGGESKRWPSACSCRACRDFSNTTRRMLLAMWREHPASTSSSGSHLILPSTPSA